MCRLFEISFCGQSGLVSPELMQALRLYLFSWEVSKAVQLLIFSDYECFSSSVEQSFYGYFWIVQIGNSIWNVISVRLSQGKEENTDYTSVASFSVEIPMEACLLCRPIDLGSSFREIESLVFIATAKCAVHFFHSFVGGHCASLQNHFNPASSIDVVISLVFSKLSVYE